MIDRETLLAPAGEPAPCGPNLEHDLAFFELEEAARGKPEQRLGDATRPAEEPRWPVVADLSQALLLRSKDLRIATHLTRALVRTDGLPGLAAGLELIHGLLERYWDGVYPRLECDRADDPTERLNALAPLVDPEAVIADVRNAQLVSVREVGQVQGREVEIALGRLAPVGAGGTAKTLGQIHAQIAAAFASDRTVPTSLRRSRDAVQNIEAFVSARIAADHAIDLKPLRQCLDTLLETCDAALDGVAGPGAAAERAATPVTVGEGSRPAGGSVLDEVRTREEAARLLDVVCAYLARHEPSNPAPLFIRRAQRLMHKDFVEIVKDLMPDSLSNLERLAGGFDQT
jgi:type VI secretion system protein ImpA